MTSRLKKSPPKMCEVRVRIMRETARAAEVTTDTIHKVWLPKSQIKSYDPATMLMTVPEWLAREKGLIEPRTRASTTSTGLIRSQLEEYLLRYLTSDGGRGVSAADLYMVIKGCGIKADKGEVSGALLSLSCRDFVNSHSIAEKYHGGKAAVTYCITPKGQAALEAVQ